MFQSVLHFLTDGENPDDYDDESVPTIEANATESTIVDALKRVIGQKEKKIMDLLEENEKIESSYRLRLQAEKLKSEQLLVNKSETQLDTKEKHDATLQTEGSSREIELQNTIAQLKEKIRNINDTKANELSQKDGKKKNDINTQEEIKQMEKSIQKLKLELEMKTQEIKKINDEINPRLSKAIDLIRVRNEKIDKLKKDKQKLFEINRMLTSEIQKKKFQFVMIIQILKIDKQQKQIPTILLLEFELTYCISMYMSQGSEFRKMILLISHGSEIFIREVLRSRITRTKEQLIVLRRKN